MSTLQVATIETNTPSGVLEVRDSNAALTAIKPGAVQGAAAGTPPVFQDSAGTEIGTLCRAWVKIASSTSPSVIAGFNVSSITYNSVGSWTVNFTNPMPSANYSGFVTFDGNYALTGGITSQTTGSAAIYSKTGSGSGYNPTYLYVAFFA